MTVFGKRMFKVQLIECGPTGVKWVPKSIRLVSSKSGQEISEAGKRHGKILIQFPREHFVGVLGLQK